MDDEKQAAFAAFDLLKSDLSELHGHAARLGDAALIASVDAHHANAQSTWNQYLEARGWTEDAGEANRSGGEDKPPKDEGP